MNDNDFSLKAGSQINIEYKGYSLEVKIPKELFAIADVVFKKDVEIIAQDYGSITVRSV